MAVAKRQGRENPAKIEQRKLRGPECGLQVEQKALLASPVYIGKFPGEGKNLYKEAPKGRGEGLSRARVLAVFLLFASFGWACPHALRIYFPFIF